MKETKEKKIGTDTKKDMLSAQDWYYSELHRALLKGYYQKFKKKLPKEISDDFEKHDFSRTDQNK